MSKEAPIIPHAKLASFEEAGLIHEIIMHGSYDFSKGYKTNYGCHAAELMFVVRNEELAVTWHFNTEWYLPHLRDKFTWKGMDGSGDLGWHYKVELSGTHEGPCNMIPGGKCYCVCSFGEAKDLFNTVVGAPEELWPRLRRAHQIGLERQQEELSDRARF